MRMRNKAKETDLNLQIAGKKINLKEKDQGPDHLQHNLIVLTNPLMLNSSSKS